MDHRFSTLIRVAYSIAAGLMIADILLGSHRRPPRIPAPRKEDPWTYTTSSASSAES